MVTLQQLPVIVLLTVTGASALSWMQQPYTNDSFNELRKYGDNVVLTCDVPSGDTVTYWVLPDTRVMQPGEAIAFATLDGIASWRVSDDGRSLTITLVQPEHFGFYYCFVDSASGQHHVVKRALNYRGAYYGDLWLKYKWNVIIGGASAGGVVVAAVLLAVVHALVTTCGTRGQGSHGGRHRSSLRDATGTLNTVFTDSDVAGIRIVTISPLDVTNGGAQRGRRTHADRLIVNTTVL